MSDEKVERVLGDGAAGDIDDPAARPGKDGVPPAPAQVEPAAVVPPQEETHE